MAHLIQCDQCPRTATAGQAYGFLHISEVLPTWPAMYLGSVEMLQKHVCSPACLLALANERSIEWALREERERERSERSERSSQDREQGGEDKDKAKRKS